MTAPTTARPRIIGAAALVTGALLLASCGAEVNSELELTEDLSGTRTIVATIAEEDIAELAGGVEGAQAALEAHLPEELSFAGIAPVGTSDETDDAADASESGGHEAVFTLEFADVDDYQTKAQALIDYGADWGDELRDSSLPTPDRTIVELNLVDHDGPLLEGFILEENFTSDELLDWASYALLTEEVITEDQVDSVFASAGGSGRVTYAGQEHEISEPFSVNEAQDYRFSDFGVLVTGDGMVADISSAFHYGDYDTGIELGQQFLDDTGVPGITHEDGYWTVDLADSDTLQDNLRLLLDNPDFELTVDQHVNTDNASMVTTLSGTGFSCPTVCVDLPRIHIEYSGAISPVDELIEGDTFEISYEQQVPIDELEITTDITLTGDIGQTFRYVVAQEHAEAFGDGLADVFAPDEAVGSIQTETTDDAMVYVATLDAAAPQDFSGILEQYLPGSYVDLVGFEGVWPSYTLDVGAYGAEALGVTPLQSVNLPLLHSADPADGFGLDEQLEAQSSSYTLVASGPTITGLIVIGGLIVLGVVGIILLIVFRKRIAAGMRAAGSHAQTMAAGANANWQAAQAQHQAAAGYETGVQDTQVMVEEPTGPMDDATWQTHFHEGKLR